MLSWKLSVLEIPLDKELTANCLVETRTKLKEVIPAAMVKYGLNGKQLPLWLQQYLINGFLFYGLSWAKVVCKKKKKPIFQKKIPTNGYIFCKKSLNMGTFFLKFTPKIG